MRVQKSVRKMIFMDDAPWTVAYKFYKSERRLYFVNE